MSASQPPASQEKKRSLTVPTTPAASAMPNTQEAPYNIEAEQILLGLLLLDNNNFDRIADMLSPHHFYDPVHATLYESIAKLIIRGHIADPTTLAGHIATNEALQEIGGKEYLKRLMAIAIPFMSARDYARVVHDLSIQRDLMKIGRDIYHSATMGDIDLPPLEQIARAEQSLYEVAERGRYEGGFQPFHSSLTMSLKMADAALKRDGKLSGVPTGFRDLDKKLGGLQKSDLVIVAGRPGMGKTAFATNLAFHAAQSYKHQLRDDGSTETVDGGIVGFFSLEMSAEQLATRILAEQLNVPSERIRRGQIKDEYGQLVELAHRLEDIPLYIDDTGGLAVATLAARARRLKRQTGLDLLVIDYLQLLSGDARQRQENRVQEMTYITTNLKALAKELDVPIIALSQLSRQVESRDDKKPQLSDLRESGSIEQDADIVMFIFREEYYLARHEPSKAEEHEKWEIEMDRIRNIAEIIVGKHRHGPTGTTRLHFDAQTTRFSNLENPSHATFHD